MLRILCNIISEKIDDGSYAYKPGNALYFSKNKNAYAAIMFTNSKPISRTSSQNSLENDEDIKCKHLYTKLLNDSSVDYYRVMPNQYQQCYNDEDVKEFRKVAEGRLSHYLKTKMKDNGDLLPFGDQFFAMPVSIAYKIGPGGSRRTKSASLNLKSLKFKS